MQDVSEAEALAALSSEAIPNSSLLSGLSTLRSDPKSSTLVQCFRVSPLTEIFSKAEEQKQEPNLQDIFRECRIEDFIFEVKSKALELIKYLNRSEIIDELIRLAHNEGQPLTLRTEPDQTKVKAIQLSCDLLSLEATCPGTYTPDNLQRIMNLLFASPLPPQLSLIAQRFSVQIPESTAAFFHSSPASLIDSLLRLETLNPDLLASICWIASPLSAVNPSNGETTVQHQRAAEFDQWLIGTHFAQKLVDLLVSDTCTGESAERVGTVLIELLMIGQRHLAKGLAPLAVIREQLFGEELLNRLLGGIFSKEKHDESSYANQLLVLLEMLKYEQALALAREKEQQEQKEKENHFADLSQHENVLETTDNSADTVKKKEAALPSFFIRMLAKHFSRLIQRLKDGEEQRFGKLRLRILTLCARLFEHLLTREVDQDVLSAVIESGFFPVILDLLFGRMWNNFIQNIVEEILSVLFTNRTPQGTEVQKRVLTECKLLDRIVEADRGNAADMQDGTTRKVGRRGYMGTLFNLSILLVKVGEENEPLKNIMHNHAEWSEYVQRSLAHMRSIRENPQSVFAQRPEKAKSISTSEAKEGKQDKEVRRKPAAGRGDVKRKAERARRMMRKGRGRAKSSGGFGFPDVEIYVPLVAPPPTTSNTEKA